MIKVILHGLGGVGQRIARLVLEKPFLECVGAITAQSEDWGKDLGELLGVGKNLGIEVTSSLAELIDRVKADVVLDATRSLVVDIKDYIFTSVRAGLHFISVCEELAYPWADSPKLAHEINELAKGYAVAVFGTGINPGFIGDLVPLMFTAPCRNVSRIITNRTTNAAGLGASALAPFAIGESEMEFKNRLKAGRLKGFTGHREVIMELADALGWRIAEIKREVAPQVSEILRQGKFFTIEPDKVCGVKTETAGFRDDGKKAITLTLMVVFQPDAVSAEEDAKLGLRTGDFITIEGDPTLEIEVKGFSDAAQFTANHAVNSIPYVIHAKPGLLSPKDFAPFAPRQ